MTPQKWNKISKFLLGIIAAALIAAWILDESSAISVVCLIVAGAAIVLFFIGQAMFWRCPRCKRRLPRQSLFYDIKRCPHCNQNLYENTDDSL